MLDLADPPAPAPAPASPVMSVRASILDPVSGAAIGGTVTAEISESHVRFRSDDGTVWAVPKDLLQPQGGPT